MTERIGPDEIDRAAAALAAGALVAFPTETVYGLGADASSGEAVARIFAAKGRPTGHPLIVHLSDEAARAADLGGLGLDPSPEAESLAKAFWPGPLTLIVARGPAVDPAATGGRDTVGLRVPDHPVALALLRAAADLGVPGVAGPSANRFGRVSPTTAAHVIDDLGSLADPAVELVVDGGACRVGVESTIIDTTGPEPALLRPGGISAVEIEAVLGRALVDDRAGPARASGMLASHYAPDVEVVLVAAGELDRIVGDAAVGPVGVIAPFDPGHRPSWVLPADASGYGARLYAALREADGAGLDRLLVVPPERGELRDAVIDRLTKAAAPREPSVGQASARRSTR